jgi:hypothetical protein
MKQRFKECSRKARSLKPMAVALALAMPSAVALGAAVNGVGNSAASAHYGRDSVYATPGQGCSTRIAGCPDRT